MLICRSCYYYQGKRDEQKPLRLKMKEIAAVRVRYGYRRVHVLLRREGWRVNHKRVFRLYQEEGLSLRLKRPKRRVSSAHRRTRPILQGPNECWSMDFVCDQLFNGQRFRALTIVDNYSRECLAIVVDYALKGEDVVAFMNHLLVLRGTAPQRIQVDNVANLSRKLWINGRMNIT